MGCYRTILVALDGSPDALAALEHAATLARDQHACLVVMTAAPSPVLASGIGSGATVVADLEPNFVHELQEAVRSLPPDVGVQSRVAHGPAARCILEVAEECRCDLIVMGFHGHGRLHHALRGSVSDTVARESHRPVLLVRAEHPAQTSADAEARAEGESIAEAGAEPAPMAKGESIAEAGAELAPMAKGESVAEARSEAVAHAGDEPHGGAITPTEAVPVAVNRISDS